MKMVEAEWKRMETTLEATVVSSKKVRAVFLTIFHVVLVYNPSNTSAKHFAFTAN